MSHHEQPRERVNIVYSTQTDGAARDVEIPLKLLVMGDLRGDTPATPLRDRKSIALGKAGIDDAIGTIKPTLSMEIPNHINNDGSELSLSLSFASLRDFEPEHLLSSIEAMKTLVTLRNGLMAVRSAVGSKPTFRRELQAHLEDPNTRRVLIEGGAS